ncbi:MAG TPA: PEP-CTERM sorting domain-containing protein, partial [Pirellulales bacterium]
IVLGVGLIACLLPAAAKAATLAADYQLQQTFDSSISGPPALAEVNTGTATGGTFSQANVNGTTQFVYAFIGDSGGGEGLGASTNTVISPATYSVVLDAELSADNAADFSNLVSKLIDFKSRSTDAGLYIVGGLPTFYNATVPVGAGTTPLVNGMFAELALTRDAAGTVAVYLNGTPEFTFDDSTSQLTTLSTSTLDLFVDDPNTLTVPLGLTLENPTGEVARVRLFDGALTANQVGALTVPEPAGLAGMILMAFAMRRRRQ